MGYQTGVYRKQGGDDLVIASSGTITMESGSTMTIASGAGATLAGTLTVASGGVVTMASGSAITLSSGAKLAWPVQTAASTATTITAVGLTMVTATTAAQTYLMDNPVVGVRKWLAIAGASSGDDTDAVAATISAATTTVTFDTSGQHVLTLSTSALRGVSLVGVTTLRWAVVGTYYQTDAGLST